MRLIKDLALTFGAVCALATAPLAAQETASADRASPELSARVEGIVGQDSQALQMAQMDVSVRIRGSLATTEMTVRFANPSNDTLEGQFGLDLPAGSVITGYALDIGDLANGGSMVEAVLQSRDRAREAFERRVVRRIDPGLAEVDFSDRFETRIYPIFPRRGRTIRIRFTSPLDAQGQYVLPLMAGEVGQYNLSVTGAEPSQRGGVQWQRDGAAWQMSGTGNLSASIKIGAPAADGLTVSEHPGEGRFFELSGAMEDMTGLEVATGAITILWDRSVSRLDDALEREAAFAERFAREAGASDVNLVLFDSGQTETLRVLTAELKDRLAAVRYAGGTSYAELPAILRRKYGTCVLFSDGRATIDERPNLDRTGCGFLTVSSGKEVDGPWLTAQTAQHNGMSVNLENMTDDQAMQQLMSPSAMPAITDAEGAAIETRSLPASDGRYRLVGPLPQDGVIMVDRERRRAASPVTPTFAGPGSLWAAQHLALVRDEKPIEELAEEARRWSVAVPGVSFIVLETPADYVEAGFTPPDSYPKVMREQFDTISAQVAEQERQRDKAYYDQLMAQWTERQAWWAGKRQVGKPEDGRAVDAAASAVAEAAEAAAEAVDGAAQLVPPPPPPSPVMAPPPPPAPPPSSARDNDNAIVVTGARRVRTGAVRSQGTQDVPISVSAVGGERAPQNQFSFSEAVVSEGCANSAINESEPSGIVTAEWSPDRPYIEEWIAAGDNWEAAVAATEKQHGTLPLFYLDLAEWHFGAGRNEEARRAAEAALELPARDNQTVEIVAQRLLRYGAEDRAIYLLTKLVDREAERPHPLMALSQAYAQRWRTSGNREDLVTAQQLMGRAAMKRWPNQFGQVGEIALSEVNAMITLLGGGQAQGVTLDQSFVFEMPVDLRIVAAWNTNRTDLDLWVVEPSGEEVGYSHRMSRPGARYTHDVTQGYGPEEYQLRRAPDGTYRVEINTFATDQRNPNGPSTITVRLIRDFGTDSPREELIDVEMLPGAQGRKLVGTIEVN